MEVNSCFLRQSRLKAGAVMLFAVFMVLVLPTISFAQRLTGGLSVSVQDSSGAAVPDAKVTVVNKAQGNTLNLTSGPDGIASAPDLSPADYSITVQHEGFKTASTTVAVRVGLTSSIALKMEIGSVSTSIEVAAEAVTVDTEKSAVQSVVTASQIDALPLNGRNFLDLAQLAPGVQVVDGGLFDPTKNQMTGVSIGGRSGRSTRIQVDGVDITDETVGTTVMNLTNESVQEFGVQQSSLDVSTDLTSSGAVNIITKSGTNTMHGSGFGFFRRDSFAANTAPVVTSTTPKPPFSRDNYGGRLGGPLIKNKLFWQAEYEKLQQQSAQTTNIEDFPQFTGSFGVPLNEHLGGGRLDFNLTDKQKLFYRFNHDDNIGTTGFGGVGLSAFANSNNANSHVAGWDYGTGSWVHSIRFSRLKFINGIVDANSLAGTPVLPVQVNISGLGGFVIGPNANAPQSTYQQNRQTKYDATYVHGKHEVKFGAEYNRIDQAGFASFFGLGPRIRASFGGGPNTADPFNADGAADPLNYKTNLLFLGNGLGALSEKPALGFPNGGFTNNRIGFYVHDTWKVRRNLTVNAGLRYDHDDGLSNADLPRAAGIAAFDPELAGKPRNDNKRFAPQVGFSWNPGQGKTVIRGGGGLYYETNIFNNLSFDRAENLPAGLGNDTPQIFSGAPGFLIDPRNGSTLFDFTTQCTNAQPSQPLPTRNSCLGAAIGNVIPFALQAQALLQAASAELAANWPPPGAGPKFDNDQGLFGGVTVLDPKYKSPYGAQINIGVQRELKPGLVLSADYIMNRGVHFLSIVERNRIGAADTLNVAAAQAAIAATLNDCGVASINAALVSCAAENGDPATIDDFAAEGLGAGSGLDGFAFSGKNVNYRQMNIAEPVGLSRYSALQVLLAGKLGTWGPFHSASANVTYTLSRFNSSSADQDFLDQANTNDNPTKFYGPSNLDRTHQFGLSLLSDLPFGFRISSTTIYRSNEPSNMFLDSGNGPVDIFTNDLDGDGSVLGTLGGDSITGKRGSYGRGVNAHNLNQVIANFNNTVAGTLTPAGKALVAQGLFTESQLQQLGAVVESVDPNPGPAVDNPNFYTTDVRVSWRYSIKDRLSIEPMMDIFNILNRDNRIGQSSIGRGGNTAFDPILSGGSGSINGTVVRAPLRVGSGSGSFSGGNPRAFQFGIRVSF